MTTATAAPFTPLAPRLEALAQVLAASLAPEHEHDFREVGSYRVGGYLMLDTRCACGADREVQAD